MNELDMDLLVFKWELVVNNKLENKMHKINDEGEIVDKDGIPIKDHKGKVIVVPFLCDL